MRVPWLVVLAGCAQAPVARPAADAPERPADQARHYTVWLAGARIGSATETETWSHAGVHLHRVETMAFSRGAAEVDLVTTVDIDADPALVARSVRWSERGDAEHMAEAHRARDGWVVSTGAQLPADSVPGELVPLLVRRDHHFAGRVFLPARGFVAGEGRVDSVAPGRYVAQLALGGAATGGATAAEATIDLDRDGMPSRVVDGEGVIAVRATGADVAAPFPAVDLLAVTSIPITGTRHGARLVLAGDLVLPALPGQLARVAHDGIEVELGARLAGALPAGPATRDRAADIRALVAAVRARITPDLAISPASARDAAATAGDCTTFALAYAALAQSRAIPTRVVTGLRVDGDHLVRHRWAISWTGSAWIAVDAAFGAAPAGGDLIGLAVHDPDDAGLIAGDAALTQIRAAAWQ